MQVLEGKFTGAWGHGAVVRARNGLCVLNPRRHISLRIRPHQTQAEGRSPTLRANDTRHVLGASGVFFAMFQGLAGSAGGFVSRQLCSYVPPPALLFCSLLACPLHSSPGLCSLRFSSLSLSSSLFWCPLPRIPVLCLPSLQSCVSLLSFRTAPLVPVLRRSALRTWSTRSGAPRPLSLRRLFLFLFVGVTLLFVYLLLRGRSVYRQHISLKEGMERVREAIKESKGTSFLHRVKVVYEAWDAVNQRG